VERAAQDKRYPGFAPICIRFGHIETLVKLGEEYKLLAEQHGNAPSYNAPLRPRGAIPASSGQLVGETLR